MQEPFNQSPDPSDEIKIDDKLAFMFIAVDEEGIIDYNVKWEPGETGLLAISSLFYKLIIDNLPLEMLEQIREQCVLNDNEGDYLSILNVINKLSEKRLDNIQGDDDSIVIPPDQVFNI